MWIDPCAIPVARLYRMNGAALLMSRTLSSFGSVETEPSPPMIEASICLGKVLSCVELRAGFASNIQVGCSPHGLRPRHGEASRYA